MESFLGVHSDGLGIVEGTWFAGAVFRPPSLLPSSLLALLLESFWPYTRAQIYIEQNEENFKGNNFSQNKSSGIHVALNYGIRNPRPFTKSGLWMFLFALMPNKLISYSVCTYAVGIINRTSSAFSGGQKNLVRRVLLQPGDQCLVRGRLDTNHCLPRCLVDHRDAL